MSPRIHRPATRSRVEPVGAPCGSAQARRRSRWWGIVGLGILLAAGIGVGALVPGCGKDDNPIQPGVPNVPESWAGIWEFQAQQYVCDAAETLFALPTFRDTICAGAPVDKEIGFNEIGNLTCAGTYTITDTDVTFSCDVTYRAGTCRTMYTALGTGHLDAGNNTLVASLRLNTDYEPNGCSEQLPDDCTEYRLQGVRVGDAPSPCVPAQASLLAKLAAKALRR